MKLFLFSSLFLLTANYSLAQAPVSDTTENITIRGSHIYYIYIDGIKVQIPQEQPAKNGVEEINVITGGIPGTYGDIFGPIGLAIPPKAILIPQTTPTISDKKQIMATE